MPEGHTKWYILDVNQCQSDTERRIAHRLNAFGSSYYFVKVILRRHRLYDPLHSIFASYVEQEHLKLVIQWPRDHFKTTICSESLPMWWALPFNDRDEMYMRALGYGDEWIRWMRWVHDQDTRTLIVSENKENINKIGARISLHFENNDLFRHTFPEILPDSSCTWGATSLMQKRTKKSPDGEGTFDMLSVGSALQSRHYNRVVEDDLIGKDALESDIVMAKTIDYHRLLPGAFDSDPRLRAHENDEIVVGNRWSARDLNWWISENEKNFTIVSHSALGGCCNLHPPEEPIFPLEWTKEKLYGLIPRYGLYYFSCQYLNNPVTEGTQFFNTEHLRYYSMEALSESDRRAKLIHEVQNGEVVKDVMPSDLACFMIVDPNHGGNSGRCRHAITVTGVQRNPLRIYLLDLFAESCSYERLVQKIYELASYWKLRECWLETVAAQRYLKFYLDYRNRIEQRKLTIRELKVDNSANAKARRIESIGPFLAEGQVWIRRAAHTEFFKELGNYIGMANGKSLSGHTVDIIDTFGYGPQVWDGRTASKNEVMMFLQQSQYQNPFENVGQAGY